MHWRPDKSKVRKDVYILREKDRKAAKFCRQNKKFGKCPFIICFTNLSLTIFERDTYLWHKTLRINLWNYKAFPKNFLNVDRRISFNFNKKKFYENNLETDGFSKCFRVKYFVHFDKFIAICVVLSVSVIGMK